MARTKVRKDDLEVGAIAEQDIIYENEQTISTSYTITTNENAFSAGPVSLADGVTVTIPTGSSWVII
jgi:hypothetical protein